nr:hypothetical protein BaRGS_025412 [Batillaria attramentaria]
MQDGYWTRVGSIDLAPNEEADANIVVKPASSWEEQDQAVTSRVAETLGDDKVDAILCVAGGWAGGNAASKSMIGYGLAKAAVHQLVKSLGEVNSGMPPESIAVAILPMFGKWTEGQERPASGSLVQLITKESKTELVMS